MSNLYVGLNFDNLAAHGFSTQIAQSELISTPEWK
jgi:hypothetical protein